jgi:hypothetical protein
MKECKEGIGKVLYISKSTDWKVKDGELVLKRKYGKFKREVYKLPYVKDDQPN